MITINIFEEKSREYEKNLDENYKKINGIFYTDIKLAKSIIEFLNIPKESTIIDPCCGTGSFIYALKDYGYKNIYGCDFDIKTVKKCKELTGCNNIVKMDTLWNSGDKVLKKLKHKKFDYVIGNPPYGSLIKELKIDTEKDFFFKIKEVGSNLFIAGLYRAFELVKDDGYISLIIPKNVLHISSYKKLRNKLLKEKKIISIVELGIHFKTVRGEQIVLTLKNSYEKGNKIKYYKYNDGNINFMSEVYQDYYEDEIIVFTDNEEIKIYDKLKCSYSKLGEICIEQIKRGRNKSSEAMRGKNIRKFGFKESNIPKYGNQIFIQNIFSAEAGITASFGGNLNAQETVTIIRLKDMNMCKYILGLLHSRVCNYFLIKFIFNNSRLTIHTDANYLNRIPIVISNKEFKNIVNIVEKLENSDYMSESWYSLNEELNSVVYNIYDLDDKYKEHIEKEMRKISANKWYGNNR